MVSSDVVKSLPSKCTTLPLHIYVWQVACSGAAHKEAKWQALPGSKVNGVWQIVGFLAETESRSGPESQYFWEISLQS